MVRQLAEVENNMNSVERIVYYAHDLKQEPPYEIPEQRPPAPWPSIGKLEINEAVLRYRHGIPLVLKGLSMSVDICKTWRALKHVRGVRSVRGAFPERFEHLQFYRWREAKK
jgi:hypothetical protein